MKLLACLPPLLLAAAALPSPVEPEEIEPGSFRFWSPRNGPAHWTSDGVAIDIAPAPCETRHENDACREGVNNQAAVTISAPGLPAYHMLTDDQASHYRVAVVRFDRRDRRPGVVIENESGGSAGNVREQLVVPDGGGYRTVWLPGSGWGAVQGKLPDRLYDISGDGAVDFVLGDGRFDGVFGCNACTPRPPLVATLRHGAILDVSRDPRVSAIYRADMDQLRPICTSRRQERNGACAAYVADAARIGEFDQAWALMLRHYERDPGKRAASADPHAASDFPESLRAFLKKTGYIPSK